MEKNIQYVTDTDDNRVAVIIPLEEYESLLEDLDVITAAYDAQNQSSRPFNDLLAELRSSGEIDI